MQLVQVSRAIGGVAKTANSSVASIKFSIITISMNSRQQHRYMQSMPSLPFFTLLFHLHLPLPSYYVACALAQSKLRSYWRQTTPIFDFALYELLSRLCFPLSPIASIDRTNGYTSGAFPVPIVYWRFSTVFLGHCSPTVLPQYLNEQIGGEVGIDGWME